jgi:membrane protease YdiL (CAAX protease family)
MPAALGVPYDIFAAPRGLLRADLAIAMFLFPVAISAVLLLFPLGAKLAWQDVFVMCALAGAHIMMVFAPAWPYDGLGAVPKIWLTDVGLYAYLVVRDLAGVGYTFVPDASDVLIGLREWLFFAPLALAIGTATGFIRFRAHLPSVGEFFAAYCATFFLVAVPEEFFFRGVLQNLLETRLGNRGALAIASILFGLSHFNKGAAFNWRYVLLAAIAGVFYGRAWRARRRLFASAITHTTVDVVWSLWFRIPHV